MAKDLMGDMIERREELLADGMTVVEWFEPSNADHMEAFKALKELGQWPKGFIPEGLEFPATWMTQLNEKVLAHMMEGKVPLDSDNEEKKIRLLTERDTVSGLVNAIAELVADAKADGRFSGEEKYDTMHDIAGRVMDDPKLAALVADPTFAKKLRAKRLGALLPYLQQNESKVNEAPEDLPPEPDAEEPRPEGDEGEPIVPAKEEPAAGVDLEKVYLGQSGDTHFYVVSDKNEAGVTEDLQVTDQEGNVIVSAKEQGLDMGDVSAFILGAIQDEALQGAQLERSVVMQYLVPQVEDEIEAEEEEFDIEPGAGEEPVPGEEEEEEEKPMPRESVAESKEAPGMLVEDEKGNSFSVELVDEGTAGETVLSINGREFRFQEAMVKVFAEGDQLTDESVKELALQTLSHLEESDYAELVGQGVQEADYGAVGSQEHPRSPGLPEEDEEEVEAPVEPEADAIPGGKAERSGPIKVEPSEVQLGVKHEMEHTSDPKVALEIALDHLAENPVYYSELEVKMGDEQEMEPEEGAPPQAIPTEGRVPLDSDPEDKKIKQLVEAIEDISFYEDAGDTGFVMTLTNGQKFTVTIAEDRRHGEDGDVDVAQVYDVIVSGLERYGDELGDDEEPEEEPDVDEKCTKSKMKEQDDEGAADDDIDAITLWVREQATEEQIREFHRQFVDQPKELAELGEEIWEWLANADPDAIHTALVYTQEGKEEGQEEFGPQMELDNLISHVADAAKDATSPEEVRGLVEQQVGGLVDAIVAHITQEPEEEGLSGDWTQENEGKVPLDSDPEEKKVKLLTEGILKLVGEVDWMGPTDVQAVRQAVAAGRIDAEWPPEEEMIDALSGLEDIVVPANEPGDVRTAYLRHIIVPKAIATADVEEGGMKESEYSDMAGASTFKQVYQVDYVTDTGEEKSTKVMAHDEHEATRMLAKQKGVKNVVKVTLMKEVTEEGQDPDEKVDQDIADLAVKSEEEPEKEEADESAEPELTADEEAALRTAESLLGFAPEPLKMEEAAVGDLVQIVKKDNFEMVVDEITIKQMDEERGVEITGSTIPERQQWFGPKYYRVIKL